MKQKILNGIGKFDENENNFRWRVLQDTINQKENIDAKFKEKMLVKEGVCDECGGFDVLSRFNERFICNACLGLINGNRKNRKDNKKSTNSRKSKNSN